MTMNRYNNATPVQGPGERTHGEQAQTGRRTRGLKDSHAVNTQKAQYLIRRHT